MKLLPALALAIGLLARPVAAVPMPPPTIGSVDVSPAATLLIPYFETDLDEAAKADTEVTIQNALPDATLAHVIVWTDLGVAVFDFNAYLTGFDIVRFRMSDVLAGLLPTTASAGQDPADDISPQGDISQDINFASCRDELPPSPPPPVIIDSARSALNGQPSALLDGKCSGRDHGDRRARGYVTIDTANRCTHKLPGDSGYFVSGGYGDISNRNGLLGSYVLTYATRGFAQTFPAAHIQASATAPETSTSGSYTFYGRYSGWSAADNREPLPTNWGIEYGADAAQATELIVWRDTKQATAPFTCGTLPGFYPLGQAAIAVFDQQEDFTLLNDGAVAGLPGEATTELRPFPAATNRISLGKELPTTYRAGWIAMNLNTAVSGATGPSADNTAVQAYVAAIHYPEASKDAPFGGVAAQGFPLDYGTAANHDQSPATYGNLEAMPRVGIGLPDRMPAATLLLPYFEVDLDDPNGVNTRFSIVSATPTAMLAHVTLYTDLGVPTFTSNIYLTGLDVAVVDLRLLFSDGLLAQTASAGQDSNDVISPQGPYAQDINFASCTGHLPNEPATPAQVAHLRAVHTGAGGPLWQGACGGSPHSDGIARGYVTVDTVNQCYFGTAHTNDFTGVITAQNSLVGSYETLDRAGKVAYGGALVSIEASASNAVTSTSGKYTFYGRSKGWNAADLREPLAAQWQAPFFNGALQSELIVWRDAPPTPEPTPCGQTIAGYPLAQQSIVVFDEQENLTEIMNEHVFPRAAQRISTADAALAVPYASGFVVLNLGRPGAGPPAHLGLAQSFVSVVHRHSAGGPANAEPAGVVQSIRQAEGL